jgi:hypothetical protein
MKFHNVQKIEFEGPDMVLMVDDRVHRVNLAKISERLAHADEAARRTYDVSPSGYGIHWPEVDEDLTVDDLVAAAAGAYPIKQIRQPSTMILNDKQKS